MFFGMEGGAVSVCRKLGLLQWCELSNPSKPGIMYMQMTCQYLQIFKNLSHSFDLHTVHSPSNRTAELPNRAHWSLVLHSLLPVG